MSGTRRIQFGLSIERERDPARSARQAEDLGFDYVTAGEHLLFHHGVDTNAMIILAAAAAVTTRIRLATAITFAPLYQAAILTWLITSMDRISKGRFELGVGIGGEFPLEFELAGVDIHQRGARTDETLEILRRLWSGEQVTFEGRFNRFRDIRWDAHPVQSHLPIWIGGRKEAAMRRAARFGDGWLPYMVSAEQFANSVRVVREEAERRDRNPDSIKMGFTTFVTTYHDSEKARRVAAEWASASLKQDLSHVVDRYLIVGNPDECRARLRAYYDAGARAAFVLPNCPAADTEEMVKLLAAEVFPEFRGTNA